LKPTVQQKLHGWFLLCSIGARTRLNKQLKKGLKNQMSEPQETSDEPVLFYEAKFYCLSNFSAFSIFDGGYQWPTVEHYYQGCKFSQSRLATQLMHSVGTCSSAHDAKKLARANSEYVRPDWNDVKLQVMEGALCLKLGQHSYVKKMLLETGDRKIIENSHKDSFWGWGPDRKGESHLGRLWMKLLEELRAST